MRCSDFAFGIHRYSFIPQFGSQHNLTLAHDRLWVHGSMTSQLQSQHDGRSSCVSALHPKSPVVKRIMVLPKLPFITGSHWAYTGIALSCDQIPVMMMMAGVHSAPLISFPMDHLRICRLSMHCEPIGFPNIDPSLCCPSSAPLLVGVQRMKEIGLPKMMASSRDQARPFMLGFRGVLLCGVDRPKG